MWFSKKGQSKASEKEYNSLESDIRLYKISLERVEEIVKKLENKWIYIKYGCNIYINESCNNSHVYTKFKVRNVNIDDDYIIIYGFEDEDRLGISKEILIQSECSKNIDEVRLILKEQDTLVDIYIKEYLPNLSTRLREIEESKSNLIITEGKTDWKHLKNALIKFKKQGRFNELDIEFFEYEEDVKMCNSTLKRICQYQSLFENEKMKIFIFDSDDENINKEYIGKRYINHGNNVYSLILPIPKHREDTPFISIENYYKDEEIKIEDENKRRLYLGYEFDKETGKHLELDNVYAVDVKKDTKPNHIIDNKVYKIEDKINGKKDIIQNKNKISIALSKNKFVDSIMNGIKPFDSVLVEPFSLVFNVISEIFENYYSNIESQHNSNAVEISKGVYLEEVNNDFKILSIHAALPKNNAIHLRDSIMGSIEMKLASDKKSLIINISIDKLIFEIPIEISEELISFLESKLLNNYNRIELHICDEDKVYISHKEIFQSSLSSALIERILNQI